MKLQAPTQSSDPAACWHKICADIVLSSGEMVVLNHIADDASVVGSDAQEFPYRRPLLASVFDPPMLLTQRDDRTIGAPENHSIVVHSKKIERPYLRAFIDNSDLVPAT
jgi:hypothetical protein